MNQIRDRFIQQTVLEFYKRLPQELLRLPFDIFRAVEYVPKTVILSYKEFASMHNIPIDSVSNYAESDDGVTHYDKHSGGYIILYNDDKPRGRQRFTIGHEIGHILLKHLLTLSISSAAQNNFYGTSDAIIEQEADWFASMALCPFPVLKKIGATTPSQIQEICDVSVQASHIKHEQYTGWNRHHIKTAWENDMVRLFSEYTLNYAAQVQRSPKLTATASLI